MMKIILVSGSNKDYAVTRSIVCGIDFLYDENLNLIHYMKINDCLKEEVKKSDFKKIYIINMGLFQNDNYHCLIKFIRDNDWNSEIILLKPKSTTLEKCWKGIKNIFDIIDSECNYINILKSDLEIILKHRCKCKYFNYRNRDVNLNIYYEKILYIYRDKDERKVRIVTDNNTHTVNIGLKDTMELLDNRFKQVHRACVVNTMRAEKFDWGNNCFILDNGKIVRNMLSKHYKDNITDYIDF